MIFIKNFQDSIIIYEIGSSYIFNKSNCLYTDKYPFFYDDYNKTLIAQGFPNKNILTNKGKNN